MSARERLAAGCLAILALAAIGVSAFRSTPASVSGLAALAPVAAAVISDFDGALRHQPDRARVRPVVYFGLIRYPLLSALSAALTTIAVASCRGRFAFWTMGSIRAELRKQHSNKCKHPIRAAG